MKEGAYWKHFSFSYRFSEKVGFVINLHNEVRNSILNDFPEKSKTVLDVGCGSGANSFYLAEYGYSEVIGLDPGESVLNLAEDKLKKLKLKNCRFILEDITCVTSFNDEHFDIILSTHVFQKIDEYEKGLKEIYRLLKKGGRFYITIPSSAESFSSWFKRYIKNNGIIKAFWDIRWLIAWTLPYVLLTKKEERKNENRWDIKKMDEIVTAAGFKKIKITPLPYFHVGCTFGVFEK